METQGSIDIIGDVHGHLGALVRLGRQLGYDVDRGWAHPDGRVLVFVGDLVDRGPDSLAVGQLVQRLVEERRAHCLMGNHEYNLLEWHLLGRKPRSSNRKTIELVERDSSAWRPVLTFLESLPLAIELPDLRIVHACWHTESVELLRGLLKPAACRTDNGTWDWIQRHVVLGSPFQEGRLRQSLPSWGVDGSHNTRHEILIKGFETRSLGPVADAEGNEWPLARARWWLGEAPDVATDVSVVFGHYWNLPPGEQHAPTAPVHVLGSAEEKRSIEERAAALPDDGEVQLAGDQRFICVDYQGMLKGRGRGCVGAYRWPEHRVAWASSPNEGT